MLRTGLTRSITVTTEPQLIVAENLLTCDITIQAVDKDVYYRLDGVLSTDAGFVLEAGTERTFCIHGCANEFPVVWVKKQTATIALQEYMTPY